MSKHLKEITHKVHKGLNSSHRQTVNAASFTIGNPAMQGVQQGPGFGSDKSLA